MMQVTSPRLLKNADGLSEARADEISANLLRRCSVNLRLRLITDSETESFKLKVAMNIIQWNLLKTIQWLSNRKVSIQCVIR